jgi:hypothetical protein
MCGCFLFASCSKPVSNFLSPIDVKVNLDPSRKVLLAIVESGDPRFGATAIEAAKTVTFEGDCDEDGKPIATSQKIIIYVDHHGRVIRKEHFVQAGDRITSPEGGIGSQNVGFARIAR